MFVAIELGTLSGYARVFIRRGGIVISTQKCPPQALMLWRAISLILCLQTFLMPFAGVWRRLLRYSSPRKRISPFSVFSTAASETTFKPIPRSVSPPGWKHFSMQIPAPTGWHSA